MSLFVLQIAAVATFKIKHQNWKIQKQNRLLQRKKKQETIER